jgi:SAM-dependent methyltransferase
VWFQRKITTPASAAPQEVTEPSSTSKPLSAAMKNVNSYDRELTPEELDRGAHRDAIGGMWEEIGRLQFEFLKTRGLRPDHKLCDVGCGALRGGIHFVRYLDPGNYYGLDINASLLEGGRRELEKAGLAAKNANLLPDDRFEMSRFGAQFHYMLAVSVFTHLYANHIVRCLTEARKVLAPGGQFLATFFNAPTSAHLDTIKQDPGGVVTWYDRDPFHYSPDEMAMLGNLAGLKTELIGAWNHPRNQWMLAFTPA